MMKSKQVQEFLEAFTTALKKESTQQTMAQSLKLSPHDLNGLCQNLLSSNPDGLPICVSCIDRKPLANSEAAFFDPQAETTVPSRNLAW